MDKRLKNIVDHFDTMKIGVDERFPFHCTMCGKCCINREDIILTPKDIYSMARELGITVQELVRQYCDPYIGADSRIPIVRLKPRGAIKRCPLMKNRKCSVHRAKPAVCAMYPLGRCLKVEADRVQIEGIGPSKIQYIFTNPACGDKSEIHTVREWLEQFHIPVEDAFFIKWQKTVLKLILFLREKEKEADSLEMELIWRVLYIGLYLKYDMERDFSSQFEKNVEEILELLGIAPADEGGEQDE